MMLKCTILIKIIPKVAIFIYFRILLDVCLILQAIQMSQMGGWKQIYFFNCSIPFRKGRSSLKDGSGEAYVLVFWCQPCCVDAAQNLNVVGLVCPMQTPFQKTLTHYSPALQGQTLVTRHLTRENKISKSHHLSLYI